MIRTKTNMTALALICIAAVLLSAGIRALAGPEAVHTTTTVTRGKMTKSTAAGQIKAAAGKNVRGKEVHKKRAATATVHISNRTGWYVDCYIDGYFAGQVGPHGSLSPLVYSGNHAFYSVVHYDDGSQEAWGPVVHSIGSSFNWVLSN